VNSKDPICLIPSTYLDGSYHVMEGISIPMAIFCLAVVIIGSHLVLARKTASSSQGFRFNLFRIPLVRSFVNHDAFPFLVQSISIALFFIIIGAGLFASQRGNIAPVLTWTWWWALLIVAVLFLGKFFCMVCPWEGLTALATSFNPFSRINKLGLNLPWPSKLRNVYPALILFILLTWMELGLDITASGSATAMLGFGMLFLAILCAIVFEKRSFCRYLCPVGRISGVYALFSSVELRADDPKVCSDCESKACLMGTSSHRGCPMFLNPATLKENTYCTLCTECVRTCPSDNISIGLRKFGTDLFQKARFRIDEAILIITLLSLTSFHGITMTPYWTRINQLLRVEFSLSPTLVFSVLMFLILGIQILVFWLGAHWSSRLSKRKLNTRTIFKSFSYAVLPIALFYHLAHNSMHFFMEAQELIPLLSDPFGLGWNLFGTADDTYREILTNEIVSWIQVGLVIMGHILSVQIAESIFRKMEHQTGNRLKVITPLILVMILYSSISIFLIASPMEMRTGF